ncbi:hypothetical protein NON00_24410 [Roseomonas sp. GC11]|uniref:hypothetical protein n=1 Tax=Roseomonas sp. GC11 TaxID=2950546 RepID=UPI00210A7451|nr:hypothetical protein [Roseomonas sp. GC11]MCQ4163043.1 hypothetical protein [Roseomonas sp. GC11]
MGLAALLAERLGPLPRLGIALIQLLQRAIDGLDGNGAADGLRLLDQLQQALDAAQIALLGGFIGLDEPLALSQDLVRLARLLADGLLGIRVALPGARDARL